MLVNLVLPPNDDDPGIICARRIMLVGVTAAVIAVAVSARLLL